MIIALSHGGMQLGEGTARIKRWDSLRDVDQEKSCVGEQRKLSFLLTPVPVEGLFFGCYNFSVSMQNVSFKAFLLRDGAISE